MYATDLDGDDIGRTIEVQQSVKSKPLRGTLTRVSSIGDAGVRVEVRTAFGIKGRTLTKEDIVELIA